MLTAAAFAALVAGTVAEMWNPPPYRRWPVLTLTVAALVLLTFVAQSLAPNLLSVLSRDPKMLSSGEIWRAVTALFAQDGGTSGLLFDLFWLLVLGTAAERRFTRTGWLVVFFLSLYWEPHGAGSSIACFALAGALCADWREGRWRWWRAGFGLAGSAAAAILLLENDIRGIGFLVGLVIGWVFAARAALVEGRAIEMPAERPNVVSISGTDTFH
jgi:membrane associated rhomboid family serine protease